jgi:hypothetical protein
MGVIPDDVISAMRGSYNVGYFFRLDTTPALHLWWGVTDIAVVDWNQETIDVSGGKNFSIGGRTYIGAGIIIEPPDSFEVLMNGAADRIDFSMSGVDPDRVADMAETAPSVVGKDVMFGFCILDERWQPTHGIISVWGGTADAWEDEFTAPSKIGDAASATIRLITTSGSVARSASSLSVWTDHAQKRVSATDRFCERVSLYYQTRRVVWPR